MVCYGIFWSGQLLCAPNQNRRVTQAIGYAQSYMILILIN